MLDGEDLDVDEIVVVEDDITEIGCTSKEKTAKFTEMCSKLSFTRVISYDITPNQSDLDTYLEKQFERSYLRKYNNIYNDRKLKRYMILEENEYVHLNIKRFTKQVLKIMIHSNIEYCERNEEDEMLYKYEDVFASVFNKHRVYAATIRNLQKKT